MEARAERGPSAVGPLGGRMSEGSTGSGSLPGTGQLLGVIWSERVSEGSKTPGSSGLVCQLE